VERPNGRALRNTLLVAGDEAPCVRHTFESDEFDASGIGYSVLLTMRPPWRGRAAWVVATGLDLVHGVAIWTVFDGLTTVAAVACQHDPTLAERAEVAELAQHWRGSLQISAIGFVLATLAGAALVAVCRWVGPHVRLPTHATAAAGSSSAGVVRITRAELQRRTRRQNRRLLSFVGAGSVVAGVALMALIGFAVWESGINASARVVRVVMTPIVGFLGFLGVSCVRRRLSRRSCVCAGPDDVDADSPPRFEAPGARR
jgi:hypothetical protein